MNLASRVRAEFTTQKPLRVMVMTYPEPLFAPLGWEAREEGLVFTSHERGHIASVSHKPETRGFIPWANVLLVEQEQ